MPSFTAVSLLALSVMSSTQVFAACLPSHAVVGLSTRKVADLYTRQVAGGGITGPRRDSSTMHQYPACQTAATLDTEECIANSECVFWLRALQKAFPRTPLQSILMADPRRLLEPLHPHPQRAQKPLPSHLPTPPSNRHARSPPTPPANTLANPPANSPAPPAAPPATSPVAAGDKEPESAALSLQGSSALGLAVSAVAAVMIVL
ncbi:hypothetical protein BDV98DRAFT_586805 [Pterulicium gracile]|uniref:Uncharacterized protein n=1 Tax=Pterulicium gracile TaxID=1884261 RepID=A0A5C3Q1L1_9AGAR|nr:hypothetical protein BDV98DRAFT_586805 [Pterula gracilis]